ncbi:MAG: malic enzyme-like NAD(P)-binding protein [Bacillota bacterium]|jgi:malate dehydrogenase (oxaloacetate-decarboxylating)|nr:malic enzyme-like NAD(P)-binding protein [Bacillota bacterium]HCD42022.1 NAD-dependent malic enzyme [Bacillota bacterium]HOJ58485.1 malic enzyme-like NAD(P)-binding protein [Bacillota bacterium]HPO80581.1 malic enzyme-like NAD(P)-binding protein [Bacillota bacterium]
MTLMKEALELHRTHRGKIEVISKVPVLNKHDLSLAYTPGVAEPCKEIHADPDKVYEYTAKGNMVAVVTNGTAVLGLGDIGAAAGLPVMEGKAVLFKAFAGVDAFPICLDTKDPDEIVNAVRLLEPVFGGVNLEDISAPACFEIESKLKKVTNMPIFHDDQHGTAIVVCAAMINALKIVGKDASELRVVINGAGAAGIAVCKLLMTLGVNDIILCDSKGAVYEGRTEGMNPYKEEIAKITNRDKLSGKLADVMKGADVFIGLSIAGCVTREMVSSMAEDPMIFAMANPIPEIMPDEARAAGAKVIATGRSDFPNQINNVLAFPGVFRGALDARATDINEEMKLAAAYAISEIITDEELDPEYVIPAPFDERVAPAVAASVAEAAESSGVARMKVSPEEISSRTYELVRRVRESWK